MTAFAIFYLMLAVLAVIVWVQLRWDGIWSPAARQLPRRRSRKPETVAAVWRNELPPGRRSSRPSVG